MKWKNQPQGLGHVDVPKVVMELLSLFIYLFVSTNVPVWFQYAHFNMSLLNTNMFVKDVPVAPKGTATDPRVTIVNQRNWRIF